MLPNSEQQQQPKQDLSFTDLSPAKYKESLALVSFADKENTKLRNGQEPSNIDIKTNKREENKKNQGGFSTIKIRK